MYSYKGLYFTSNIYQKCSSGVLHNSSNQQTATAKLCSFVTNQNSANSNNSYELKILIYKLVTKVKKYVFLLCCHLTHIYGTVNIYTLIFSYSISFDPYHLVKAATWEIYLYEMTFSFSQVFPENSVLTLDTDDVFVARPQFHKTLPLHLYKSDILSTDYMF